MFAVFEKLDELKLQAKALYRLMDARTDLVIEYIHGMREEMSRMASREEQMWEQYQEDVDVLVEGYRAARSLVAAFQLAYEDMTKNQQAKIDAALEAAREADARSHTARIEAADAKLADVLKMPPLPKAPERPADALPTDTVSPPPSDQEDESAPDRPADGTPGDGPETTPGTGPENSAQNPDSNGEPIESDSPSGDGSGDTREMPWESS